MSKNDNFFNKKKEWSKIKDELLGCYLKPYFLKIFHTKRPVVYVDGFAGKGKFDDGEDGSPLIALKIIDECINSSKKSNISVLSYFIDNEYASDLKKNLLSYKNIKIIDGTKNIKIIDGTFEEKIDEILSKHKKENVFLYIDPYGIKSLDIFKLKTILKKFELASVEILINFNSFGFYRQARNILKKNDKSITSDYSKFFFEYDNYSTNSEKDMDRIFGSHHWKEIVREKNGFHKIEEKLSKQFQNNLQEDGFKYVLSIPIKNKNKEKFVYRMVHATNHMDGCILMADNMYKRSQRRDKKISLFELDINDKIINPRERTENLLSLIDNNEIEIHELLCNYFINFGIDSDSQMLINLLRKEDKLIIRREPEKTKTGKLSRSWSLNKNKIFLRKNQGNVKETVNN